MRSKRVFKKVMTSPTSYRYKGVVYHHETHEMLSCLFCNIHRRTEPGTIEYEDEDVVIFRTIKPITPHHYLVTPRDHIKNLSNLLEERDEERRKEGARILYRLKQAGMKILHQKCQSHEIVKEAKYCFHVPPYNSIDHLHLHAIGQTNQISLRDLWKYPPWFDTFYCKNVDSLIRDLSPSFYEDLRANGKLTEYHSDNNDN